MKTQIEPCVPPPMGDLVDDLEAEGSELSLRAARYIRIKRSMEHALMYGCTVPAEEFLAAPETSYAAIRGTGRCEP